MIKQTLETLPKELLIHILEILSTFEDFKALISSSSSCYEAYMISQYNILFTHIKRHFSPPYNLPEALLVIRSRGLSFCHHKEDLLALLDSWRRREEIKQLSLRSSAEKFALDHPINVKEAIDLLNLHEQLQFFLDDYSRVIFEPLWREILNWGDHFRHPVNMSSLEQAQFLRALCRLYTLRNICGPIDRISEDWDEEVMKMGFDIHAKPDRIGVYRCFYGVIPRWEAQEMGCVYNYLLNRTQPIYEAVYNDYDAIFESGIAGFTGQDFDNDEYIRFRMPLPVISYLLKEGILKTPPHPLEDSMLRQSRRNLTSFMVCWGPELIYRLLQTPRERRWVLVWNHLPSNFDKNDRLPRGLFVGITRIAPISVRLGHIYPADRHERRSDFRQFWSTLPAIEQPSEGFKSLCLNWEHFGLSHEYCMSTDGLATVEKYQCEWGFALWDRERLAQFGFPLKDNPNMIVRHPASPYRPPGFF